MKFNFSTSYYLPACFRKISLITSIPVQKLKGRCQQPPFGVKGTLYPILYSSSLMYIVKGKGTQGVSQKLFTYPFQSIS